MKFLIPTRFMVLIGLFTLLTVFCMVACSQTGPDYDDFQEVTVRTRGNCNETILMDRSFPGYTLISELGYYRCSRSERGFKCQTRFLVPDPFELLGFRLCVDLQDVADGFRSQCQLKVEVTSPSSPDILKGIYCRSDTDSPTYACVSGDSLFLTYGTRPTVRVCPTILDYLFTNKFKVGSVLLKQEQAVYDVHLGTCSKNDLPQQDEFIVRVHSFGYNPSGCPVYDRSVINLMTSRMRGCLSLIYMSDSYFCNIEVSLSARNGRKQLKLEVPRRFRGLPQETASICKDFNTDDDGDVTLNISALSFSGCQGKFAVKVSFSPIRDEVPEDSSELNSPRVFMAVFIALIIICLVCLAFTCLCCIRFRTKRLRNARRRRHQGAPTTNAAFDGPSAPDAHYEGNISWSQSDPGMIFGLPSYEDITGERPDGVNPAGDRAHKDDLPPSYESIFAEQASGN